MSTTSATSARSATLLLMTERIRRLVQPVPTSPTDSFKRSDKRPARAQMLAGVRKAVSLIASFAVLLGLFGGMAVLSGSEKRATAEVVSWCGVLALATAIIFVNGKPMVSIRDWFFFGPPFFGSLPFWS